MSTGASRAQKGNGTGTSPERRPARRQSRRPVGRASQLRDLWARSPSAAPAPCGTLGRSLRWPSRAHAGPVPSAFICSTPAGQAAQVEDGGRGNEAGPAGASGQPAQLGSRAASAVPPPLLQLSCVKHGTGSVPDVSSPFKLRRSKGRRKKRAQRTRVPRRCPGACCALMSPPWPLRSQERG